MPQPIVPEFNQLQQPLPYVVHVAGASIPVHTAQTAPSTDAVVSAFGQPSLADLLVQRAAIEEQIRAARLQEQVCLIDICFFWFM